VAIPTFQPLPLVRRPQPFSHPDWLFEVKHDGFRALAYAENGSVRLVSRNGNTFTSFKQLADGSGEEIKGSSVVLDGEIVCLNENGHSQFNQLLFRRGTPRFCAFDLLWLNGRDIRELPLIERKRALRNIVPKHPDYLLYVDYIEGEGEHLFKLVCERDLEGIVAKHRWSRYAVEDGNLAWLKIRNPRYTQMVGRDELFERRYEAQGAPEFGWDTCARACAAASSV
jgi:bifunctional non-homologous end joining protein LigD